MDGGLGGFSPAGLQRQHDAGTGDGRRVRDRSAREVRLVEELGDEACVVRADERHELMTRGLHGLDDGGVHAGGPHAVERSRRSS